MRTRAAAGCATCGAPVAADQRYCLRCGARLAPKGPLLLALLARLNDSDVAVVPSPQPAPVANKPARGPRLPARPVSALLVALFLGFGTLIGTVTGSPPAATLAAAGGQHLKLLLPPKAPESPSAGSGASASPEAEEESEPPAGEAEETPAPSGSSSKAGAGEKEEEKGSSSAGGGESRSSTRAPLKQLPAVKHVFLIVLSDQPYAALFGPESKASYLSRTLEKKGELLVRYDAVAHEQLANEIALVSGQGPTAETAADCPDYASIVPASSGADGQVLGTGCVYPSQTKTIAAQLEAKRLTWRAYVQGTDESAGQPGACSHPALGAADPTSGLAAPTGAYSTSLDPFMYFRSVTGEAACAKNAVGLAALKGDLAKPKRTPSFAYIAPDRCHDGAPVPCGLAGASAGTAAVEGFLKQVVPEILAAKAYKQDGLLVITADEAPSGGELADSSSCCGQPAFPNLAGTSSGPRPRGGGAVGALLLSPFVKGASTSQEPFNHFSLLRTIEDLFGLSHLGYAGAAGLKSLPPALFVAKG